MNKEQLIYLITKAVTELGVIKTPGYTISHGNNSPVFIYDEDLGFEATLQSFNHDELKVIWQQISEKHPTTAHKYELIFDKEPEINPEL